jgi:CubicO group peptidase (beta-lactamase class C family)
MPSQGATKLLTFTDVQPGATVHGWWNNANAEVYRLNAWPKVAAGVDASAEVTRNSSVKHHTPSERELHFYVKNTGAAVSDIEVWAFWWNWTIGPILQSVRAEFGVPALGGAIVTRQGIAALDVAGIRKHGSDVAVDAGDRWHIGSDTKAMTATLLAVLAAKGAVGMDITVADAFPEWVETMNPMFKETSFERLMAHRSGIVDVTAAESHALSDMTKSVTKRRRQFAQLLTHREHGGDLILNAPGLIFSYQNANFILAGAMLERCTGKSWEDLMKTELFVPLGMTTAGFGAPGSGSDVSEPYGHSDASGQRVASKSDNTPALGPAGTVHASLADWATFIRLHLDGSEGSLTLSSSAVARLHIDYPPNSMYPNRYGWGWIMWDDVGGLALGHDGSNTLWYCSCQVHPNEGVGFLAVSNIGGANRNIGATDYGNGDAACWKVIQTLREHHFES